MFAQCEYCELPLESSIQQGSAGWFISIKTMKFCSKLPKLAKSKVRVNGFRIWVTCKFQSIIPRLIVNKKFASAWWMVIQDEVWGVGPHSGSVDRSNQILDVTRALKASVPIISFLVVLFPSTWCRVRAQKFLYKCHVVMGSMLYFCWIQLDHAAHDVFQQ